MRADRSTLRMGALALLLAAAAGGAEAQWIPPTTPQGASSPDPRDLGGVWWTEGYDRTYRPVEGGPPPWTPRAKVEFEHRAAMEKAGTPMADAPTHCYPHGVPRVMASPYPLEIVHSPGQITILHEVGHNVRSIYLDQPVPKDPKPTFLGHSVGRWEGDTLVVETVGLNDRTMIDEEGTGHSDQLKVTERIRKIDGGRYLEDLITLEDPVYFTKPWTTRRTYGWRTDTQVGEYICEENNRNRPVGGMTAPGG